MRYSNLEGGYIESPGLVAMMIKVLGDYCMNWYSVEFAALNAVPVTLYLLDYDRIFIRQGYLEVLPEYKNIKGSLHGAVIFKSVNLDKSTEFVHLDDYIFNEFGEDRKHLWWAVRGNKEWL